MGRRVFFPEDLQVLAVFEPAVTGLAGYLGEDASPVEATHEQAGCLVRGSGELCQILDPDNRPSEQ